MLLAVRAFSDPATVVSLRLARVSDSESNLQPVCFHVKEVQKRGAQEALPQWLWMWKPRQRVWELICASPDSDTILKHEACDLQRKWCYVGSAQVLCVEQMRANEKLFSPAIRED